MTEPRWRTIDTDVLVIGGGVAGCMAAIPALEAGLEGVPVRRVDAHINDPEFADGVMARDGFEYITLARAFHADPYYVRHLEEGGAKAILPCMGCNTCLNFAGLRQSLITTAKPIFTDTCLGTICYL